jgi:hypothetical protein
MNIILITILVLIITTWVILDAEYPSLERVYNLFHLFLIILLIIIFYLSIMK